MEASVEAAKFCNITALTEEGTEAIPDCGSMGYAAQYTVPGIFSVEATVIVVFVACILCERIFGAGCTSLNDTDNKRIEEVKARFVVQVDATQGEILKGLKLVEAPVLLAQCSVVEQGSAQSMHKALMDAEVHCFVTHR